MLIKSRDSNTEMNVIKRDEKRRRKARLRDSIVILLISDQIAYNIPFPYILPKQITIRLPFKQINT